MSKSAEATPEPSSSLPPSPAPAGEAPQKLPPAAADLFRFQISNAFCWSILLSFPIVLYFKSLGASATLLGVVMGVAPFMAILQIPAAGYVEQVGYRKFVFIGWTTRTVISVLMALTVIATPWIGGALASYLTLAWLIGFATARGISSTGILPWFTQLIPSEVRGRYLSLEQISLLGSVVITSLGSALVFKLLPGNLGFSVIIAFGSCAGIVSLFHLRKIPDIEVQEERRRSRQPVPWAAILGHKNFRKILLFNAINLLAWTGGSVAIVPMLSDQFAMGDGNFMILHAAWSVASIAALFGVRGLLDHTGSKPLLQMGILIQFVHFGAWGLIAAGVLPLGLPALAFTQITWGLIHAFYSISNMRMVVEAIPPMGRSHFFAIFSVVSSLAAGVFPILWGMLIDALAPREIVLFGQGVSHFALIYGIIALIALANSIALARIQEKGVMKFHQFLNEMLITSPARSLGKLVNQRPYFR